MKRAAIGLALLAAGVMVIPSTGAESEAIPDDRIGLVHEDIEAVPVPGAVEEDTSEPGERPLVAAWNEESPPPVPHGIGDFVPITRDENACVDCHEVAEKAEGEPTPLPPSHYRDLRNAPETLRESIAGSRWVCTACHVAQTAAEPLLPDSD